MPGGWVGGEQRALTWLGPSKVSMYIKWIINGTLCFKCGWDRKWDFILLKAERSVAKRGNTFNACVSDCDVCARWCAWNSNTDVFAFLIFSLVTGSQNELYSSLKNHNGNRINQLSQCERVYCRLLSHTCTELPNKCYKSEEQTAVSHHLTTSGWYTNKSSEHWALLYNGSRMLH